MKSNSVLLGLRAFLVVFLSTLFLVGNAEAQGRRQSFSRQQKTVIRVSYEIGVAGELPNQAKMASIEKAISERFDCRVLLDRENPQIVVSLLGKNTSEMYTIQVVSKTFHISLNPNFDDKDIGAIMSMALDRTNGLK